MFEVLGKLKSVQTKTYLKFLHQDLQLRFKKKRKGDASQIERYLTGI